ncbi:DegT/DnrJ/EryC1/StrS family aminotransferase [Aurantimicrobium minutum]|uniref:DegT/DnrJ/EryC1/StrS family aminotransferase n=1 Tax=Aurantimicrobium minutum TaxID=708131 RepID=UPI0024745BD1|nr:DegT/DnrJ/EryC1/StrS family aminotransferase [Aurantimicrobium minutum]MDH6255404.1 aminotransferase EvaB [Aurantimicrobium minutum]
MADVELVPFNDLSRSVNNHRKEINQAISQVLDSGWFVLGPQHEALEAELSHFIGVDHAVNVGNGTDALELAMAALGVTEGSLVLTVANAGAYTTTAALLLGAEPVYVDVDPKTLLMSAETLSAALANLSEKPTAIVVTHLYGAVAPMREIMAVASRHGIPVLEDCAQSFGASRGGRQSGSFADISTTSFYPTKNLGALGDGGAVFTQKAELAEKVRRMRQYGWASKYSIKHSHGKNSRLDEMQAAILRVKLPHLLASNSRRKDIHERYEQSGINSALFVNTVSEAFNAHLAVVTSASRTSLRDSLRGLGVPTEIHYPIPDHKQQFPDFTPRSMPLEVTEWAAGQVFSLPMFAELTAEEVDKVVSALSKH